MKVRQDKLISGGTTYIFAKPNICPHCGVAINAERKDPKSIGGGYYAVLFQCTVQECEKFFFATYSTSQRSGNSIHLAMNTAYPLPSPASISGRLLVLSPEFAQRCSEAFASENQGHELLAACGYRNAIEVLLKDYAVKYCGCVLAPEALRRLSINECIKRYLDGLDISVSAYFAKEEGNKATHYPKLENEPFSFSEFKAYFELLLASLDSKVRLHELAQTLPPKFVQKFDSTGQPTAEPDAEDQ